MHYRLVPHRSTSLMHLRDGLARLIYIRMHTLTLSTQEYNQVQDALRKFLTLFPMGRYMSKGSSIYLVKHDDKRLTIYLDVRSL
jgi:hypothetical protein